MTINFRKGAENVLKKLTLRFGIYKRRVSFFSTSE
jgi:hypothetical protein